LNTSANVCFVTKSPRCAIWYSFTEFLHSRENIDNTKLEPSSVFQISSVSTVRLQQKQSRTYQ
jgi:hypothetical protein